MCHIVNSLLHFKQPHLTLAYCRSLENSTSSILEISDIFLENIWDSLQVLVTEVYVLVCLCGQKIFTDIEFA